MGAIKRSMTCTTCIREAGGDTYLCQSYDYSHSTLTRGRVAVEDVFDHVKVESREQSIVCIDRVER